MNIGLLSILHNKKWDFRPDMAQTYANALKNAIELQLENDIEKQHGYFLSKKGYQKDGQTVGANFEDKLYVGNIHRIENHLYWNDEELQDDDQIINVVVVDGPITRGGGGCSYGSKDWRDQVMYANTIPQVIGHLFIGNSPGGEAAARNDYEMMINDCREKKKPTVGFVDGMCCSSLVNLFCRLDRVIVMNPKDEFGCIGTMAAFWAVAHDTVDQDGYRYVELVGKDCPEKNAWWREAAKGEYEKLQTELNEDTEQFHQTVRENRPLVTDDMLSGKVFEAQEVIPALVDEIGDMERAIECIFALANEEMQAARFMTAPEPDGEGGEPESGNEPEELAKLNGQQKAAINKEKGNLMVVDDGHVSAEREGLFGPHMEEIATPKNDTTMTEEEKKVDETVEQPTTTTEAPAQEKAPAQEEQETTTEAPATEEPTTEETATEEAPATEEPATEEPATEEGAANGTANAGAEDVLKSAEVMIVEKDKEIASLKESLATLTGIADERDAAVKELDDVSASLEKAGLDYAEQGQQLADAQAKIAEHVATIEKLKTQVADLKAEVKELSEKPAPMVDAAAGVPADNGTGEAPQVQGIRSVVTEDMTPEEMRAALRRQDEELKALRGK